MRVLFLALCLGAAHMLYAQQATYKPMVYSTIIYKAKKAGYIKQLSPRYVSSDKKYKTEWNNHLYDIYGTYATASGEQQFIVEPYVVKYLQNVLQQMLDANGIKDKIEIVCTRYQEANAYNMGDNRLYVNIGLLKLLDNEAQLAFLLSHELSHYLMHHVQEKFRTVTGYAADKKVKAEMKDIRQARYNKLDRTMQFATKYRYTFANYSRAKERAADSMAIVLLQKTTYDILEGKSLMRILGQSDSDRIQIDYNRFFATATNKLRPELLEDNKYNISFGHKRAISYEEDSIKSHPDIPMRISFIDEKTQQTGERVKFIVSKPAFDSIRRAATYEIIESFETNKRYAATMYHSLDLLQRQPTDTFLIKRAAGNFRKVIYAVRDHTIQNHIPVESEANSLAYNQLLRIIDRASNDELTQLYNNFIENYAAALRDDYSEFTKL